MTATLTTRHQQARVWVVDDDRELLNLLLQRIEHSGWLPQGFESGSELEQALAEGSPQVLVLDRLLPHQNGTHLLQRLRQRGHRFPVLMLSALGTAESRIEGLEVGADDYMAKPFLWRELQLRLERLLDLHKVGSVLPPLPQGFRLNGLRFDPTGLVLSGSSGVSVPLSRGEARLLSLFCLSPGITLEREQLLQSSGSLVTEAGSRTLDVRISKLRRLINDCEPGCGSILEAVRGRGYRLNAAVQVEQQR